MPSDFNSDEQIRQQQLMVMRTAQKLEEKQNMDYSLKVRHKDTKAALQAAGIFLGILFVVVLLIQGGVL